jgi:hypothetical protein
MFAGIKLLPIGIIIFQTLSLKQPVIGFDEKLIL